VDLATARSLFEDYVRNTDRYWPRAPDRGDHRQARKLRLSLQGVRQEKQIDADAAIEWIATLALARAAARPPPLYVMGLGGSGSHWLAEMLAELLPAFYVTEVYVPRKLVEAMGGMPAEERGYVVDCLHLAHLHPGPEETRPWGTHPQAELSDEALIRAGAVNAAAGVIHRRQREWDPGCFVVRMLRDPRDQVLSVTFRKRAYRDEVAPGDSDEEYMLKKVAQAVRNHRAWRDSPLDPDFVCRYEDLRSSTVETLERLLAVRGTTVERERIATVARDHDATLMQSGAVSPRGNLHVDVGFDSEPDDRLLALLHSELAEIRAEAGYPAGGPGNTARDPASPAPAERRLPYPSQEGGQLIVVVGRGHSGTRVLSHTLLGSGVFLGKWLNAAGDKIPGDRMYDACRVIARHVDWDGDLSWDFTQLHSMSIDPGFVELTEEYLRDVVDSRRARRGWKLPETNLAYPWITRLFPQAYYVHIVRDPKDCLLGRHLTDDLADWGVPCPRVDDPIEQRVASWKYQYEIVTSTPTPERFLTVRYEDIVLDQEPTLQRLEAFLGFALARIVVNPTRVGKWRADPSVLPHLGPLAGHMRDLGYELQVARAGEA
jgi:hypothetical protein